MLQTQSKRFKSHKIRNQGSRKKKERKAVAASCWSSEKPYPEVCHFDKVSNLPEGH